MLDPSFLQDVNVSVLPRADNTYDIGSSTRRWRNLEVAGYGNLGSVRVGGVEVIDGGRRVKNVLSDNATSRSPGEDVIAIALDTGKTNCFAHTEVVKTEYYDFATDTWVDWGATATRWVDNNPWTYVTIGYERRRFRFTLYGPFSWAQIAYFIFKWEWTPTGERQANVTIESSSDGTTWVVRRTATILTGWLPRLIPYGTSFGGHPYVRVTVDIALASGETAVLNEVVAVNTRWQAHSIAPTYTTDHPGNLVPKTDNTYSLGNSSLRWRDIWIGGNAYVAGNLGVGTTTPAERLHVAGNIRSYSILPDADNTYDLGSPTLRWRNLHLAGNMAVGGVANVGSLQVGGATVVDGSRRLMNVASVAQSLLPDSDGTYDLGSSTLRWRDVYATAVKGALISLD